MTSYPNELATAKHQLMSPSPSSPCFSSTSALFQALSQPAPNVPKVANLYSYATSERPLSRDLLVVGFASVSFYQQVEHLWSNTQLLTVKKKDDRLPEKDLHNTEALATWLHKLGTKLAVTAKDKYGRFALLRAVSSDDLYADCMVQCYVGEVDKVKEYLDAGKAAPANGLWQPPEEESNTGGLWQPPPEASTSNGGLWQPPEEDNTAPPLWQPETFEGTVGPWEADDSSRKRPRETFHQDSGAAAADQFYSNLTRSLDTRADSKLYHMRAFNGWVKATQIAELDPKTSNRGALRVLDLACGKGGDLGKWVLHDRGILNYVGSDVARGSLQDAAIRARAMRKKLPRCTFTCADLGADVPGRLRSAKHTYMQKLLTWSLEKESEYAHGDPDFKMVRGGGISMSDKFDVVSIQFAIHYMMSSRQRARRFFQTVSELLDIGGNLIVTTIDARVVMDHMLKLGLNYHYLNVTEDPGAVTVKVGGGACQIRFEPETVKRIFSSSSDGTEQDADDLFGLEYTFTLVEGSDHASGVGDAVNLPEWLSPLPLLKSLAADAGLELDYAQNFHEFFKERENPASFSSAHTALYNMKVLNRKGSISSEEWEISRLYMALKFRKVRESRISLDESDDEAQPDDEMGIDDIDPEVKMKLMPMAMMKAKKAAGAEWKGLLPDEKTALIEAEVVKLAKT